MRAKIYHNPKCSKSCDALELLQSRDLDLEIVEYLETPLNKEELCHLIKLLGVAPSSLVRARDLQRLGLPGAEDADGWMQLLLENPALLERPIVVVGSLARIGRPIDQVEKLLSEASE
ncbi:ArsC/Spx/MgsR family protein [Aeoliella sp.]|uniref:ArsC/Spx/MgsR family protein n=1 Tax=Aeoliella sp. TaxID=2795800 RepID=UPI003CCBE3A5